MVLESATLTLSRDEIVARIEHEAKRRLGMSARDLLIAYQNGKLKDCGQVADLLSLADLLDPSDPIFVAAA